MQSVIEPGYVSGTITIPASKSMMQRVCAAALLHSGRTKIINPGVSNDDKAALHIIAQLGATVTYLKDGSIEIVSNGIAPVSDTIHCGESGLSARMFLPIAALSDKPLTITGNGSLLKRPMQQAADALMKLGVNVDSDNAHLPFHIKGPMRALPITLDGQQSSQYLTGFIFAYAFAAEETVAITVQNLNSKPYIDMTLEVLERFGCKIFNDNYTTFQLNSHHPVKSDITYTIEADWSSAAFWLVAAAINGDLKICGLNMASHQADKAIMDVLAQAGVQTEISDSILHVKQTSTLQPFYFDATHSPDLFPVLSVLAAYCAGESRISGLHRLVHKESNRVDSITAMLSILGIEYKMKDDELIVTGGKKISGGTVSSFNDHRIAMAAAVAALGAERPVLIEDADSVAKSYPDFFAHLSQLGGRVTIKQTNT